MNKVSKVVFGYRWVLVNPVSTGLQRKAETGKVLILLLMLQNRSGVFEKYYNNSDYFPLPLHSKKTAGEIRQFSFYTVWDTCHLFRSPKSDYGKYCK